MVEVGVVKDFYDVDGKIVVKKSYDFIEGVFDIGNKLMIANGEVRKNVTVKTLEIIDYNCIISFQEYNSLEEVRVFKGSKLFISAEDYDAYNDSLLNMLGLGFSYD